MGEMIKKVRLERNLTQEELGKLIGVQRAQISKLENNTTNVTIETILKVFGMLRLLHLTIKPVRTCMII